MAEASSSPKANQETDSTTTTSEDIDSSTATNGSVESPPPTKLEESIIRQIEYYFGDQNLRRDKFLLENIQKNDGWIQLETLVKFNRLRVLSTDFKDIVKALRKSTNKLIEINEDEISIRRLPDKPIPEDNEETKKDIFNRTVYVKGFPTETILDELIEFFKRCKSVENIIMRRVGGPANPAKGIFKGSVFITFSDIEEMRKFLAEEKVLYKETVLLRETRADYQKRKHEEFKQRKKEGKDGDTPNKKQKQDKEVEEKLPTFTPGCVLHIKSCNTNTSREDIKEVFDTHAKVAWIDFKRGDTEAWVRFDSPSANDSLEKAKKANDGKLEIQGAEVTANVIEGADEIDFYKRLETDKIKSRQKSFRKGGHGGRGRGGRDRGRGRGRGRGFGHRFKADRNDSDNKNGGDAGKTEGKGVKRQAEGGENASAAKITKHDDAA